MATRKVIKTYILPFACPTWNRILAMGIWQRKSLRHLIHSMVTSVVEGKEIIYRDMDKYMSLIRPKAKKSKKK